MFAIDTAFRNTKSALQKILLTHQKESSSRPHHLIDTCIGKRSLQSELKGEKWNQSVEENSSRLLFTFKWEFYRYQDRLLHENRTGRLFKALNVFFMYTCLITEFSSFILQKVKINFRTINRNINFSLYHEYADKSTDINLLICNDSNNAIMLPFISSVSYLLLPDFCGGYRTVSTL